MSMRSRTVRIVALAVAVVLSVGVLGVPASTAQPGTTQPWTDRHLSPEQRARLLMEQMTLAEKVDLMTGNQGEAPYAFYNAPIPRLGIPALKMADAGGGVAPRGWSLPEHGRQRDRDALGDGAGRHLVPGRRCASSPRSSRRRSARPGQNVLLAPDTDIARLPWGGRISESQGEDPFLNGDQNSVYAATAPVAQRHRHAEALHRQQPGDQPRHRPERDHDRAHAA